MLQWSGVTLLFVTYVHGLYIPLGNNLNTENTHVAFDDVIANTRVRRDVETKVDIQDFPENTVVHLNVDKKPIDIRLQRSQNFKDIPLYLFRNGRPEKVPWTTDKRFAVYQSAEKASSFLVSLVRGTNGTYHRKIFGTFVHNMTAYAIQPVREANTENKNHHEVSELPNHSQVFEDKAPRVADFHFEEVSRHVDHHGNRRLRRQTQNYYVELFTVVDYKNYLFWYNMTSTSDRHSEAVQMIMEYMTYMVNAVDTRYKSVTGENFVISVMSAGIYIADTPEASPWSEDKSVDGRLDSGAALDSFTEWIQQQNNLPQFDHAMGFTGYDIASTGTNSDSSGISFTGSLCSSQSTSVVEDKFNFIAMTTAAHELGHSLGALHDGVSNTCNGNDNYIMASVNSVRADPLLGQHLWQFSSCSVQEFKSYIQKLNSFSNNCMLSTSGTSQRATTLKPMAEVYGADVTCINSLGQGSYVCRSVQNYSSICTGMFCNQPGTTQCYSIIPAEGTPCGKGKWCEKGKCLASARAPQDNADNCPIGDRPGLFDDTQKTCEQLIQQDPGYCYSAYVGATCCASCNAAKTNDPACQYGDHNATFCPTMSRYGCYRNEDFCCQTCKERKNLALPGCEFGDKYTGCQKKDCPFYDATNLAGCCETCADPANTVKTSTTTKATTTTSTTTTSTSTTSTSTTTSTTSSTTTKSSTPSTTAKPTSISTSSEAVTSKLTVPSTSDGANTDIPVMTSSEAPKQEKVSEILIVAVGCSVGTVVVIVIVVIICVVLRRKKMATKGKKGAKDSTYDNIGFVAAIADKPSHPPPRRSRSPSGDSQNPSLVANNNNLGSTEYVDGYMLPAAHSQATTPTTTITVNGVHYSAPNKPKFKLPAKPHMKVFTVIKDNAESSKRNSKPVHYKRTSNISNTSSTGSNDRVVNGLANPTELAPDNSKKCSAVTRKVSETDAYDSIGEVDKVQLQPIDCHRPTLPENHPRLSQGIKQDKDNHVRTSITGKEMKTTAGKVDKDIRGKVQATTKNLPEVPHVQPSVSDKEVFNYRGAPSAKDNIKMKVLPDIPIPRPRIRSSTGELGDNNPVVASSVNRNTSVKDDFSDLKDAYDEVDSRPVTGNLLKELKPPPLPKKPAARQQVSTETSDVQHRVPVEANVYDDIDLDKGSPQSPLSSNSLSHFGDQSNLHQNLKACPKTHIANAVIGSQLQTSQPPRKPVPRRKRSEDNSDFENKAVMSHENTLNDNKPLEAESMPSSPDQMFGISPDGGYLHMIPPQKPVPRRQRSAEGQRNPAFVDEEMEIRI